jgi:ADP-heptose:LPS heptosyltransferase
MKLFLLESQSPGDILQLTAAVRDLKSSHPDYHINVRTSAQELWQNNPWLDRSVTEQNADRVIKCQYPLIHQSTRGSHHFIHGFSMFLEQQLGIKIPTGDFRVDVHLSEQEKNDPYISNIIGALPKDRKIWLVDAGYKPDFTNKFWEFSRFQEVVDRTSDRIAWIQIGASNHLHRPLENVVNLVGKTTHRQLISLMYRADGVLTPVSYPMHLSTMQWKDHPNEHRPCVVIAGSREPSVWEQYTCHQYIHNCGILKCSKNGACWKSRIARLNDGSRQDMSLCVNPVMTKSGQVIPRCLDIITVDEVVRRICLYLDNM